MVTDQEIYLSPQQLAGRYDLPLRTIYAMNTDGTGPRRMRIGRRVRYRLADVLAWEKTRYIERAS